MDIGLTGLIISARWMSWQLTSLSYLFKERDSKSIHSPLSDNLQQVVQRVSKKKEMCNIMSLYLHQDCSLLYLQYYSNILLYSLAMSWLVNDPEKEHNFILIIEKQTQISETTKPKYPVIIRLLLFMYVWSVPSSLSHTSVSSSNGLAPCVLKQ